MITVTAISALMQCIIPRDVLNSASELIGAGEEIEQSQVVKYLIYGGYTLVDMVENIGEYSLRGGILDFWCPYNTHPVRIEFFGDEIDSMRLFDYQSQCSIKMIEDTIILPVSEVLLNQENINRLKKRLDTAKSISYKERTKLDKALGLSKMTPGMQHYLGYLYTKTDTLFDYLPDNSIVVLDEYTYLKQRSDEWEAQISAEYEQTKDYGFPPPKDNYLTFNQIQNKLQAHQVIQLDLLKSQHEGQYITRLEVEAQTTTAMQAVLRGRQGQGGYLGRLAKEIKTWQKAGEGVWFICHNRGQSERLQEILAEYELNAKIADAADNLLLNQESTEIKQPLILEGGLSGGFYFPQLKLKVITET